MALLPGQTGVLPTAGGLVPIDEKGNPIQQNAPQQPAGSDLASWLRNNPSIPSGSPVNPGGAYVGGSATGDYSIGPGGNLQTQNPQVNSLLNPKEPVTQEDAYTKLLSQAQNEISSIESSFQPLLQGADIHGKQRQGAVDALIAGGMIAGESGKTAATEGATAATTQEKANILSQMNSMISAVYTKVQENSISLAELGQKEAKDAQEYVKKIQSDAMNNLKTLASNPNVPVTAEMLQKADPNLYNQLKIQSGMSDYQISNYMYSNMDKKFQPYDVPMPDEKGMTVIKRIQRNADGSYSEQDYPLQVPFAAYSPSSVITDKNTGATYYIGADGKAVNAATGEPYVPTTFKTMPQGSSLYNVNTGQQVGGMEMGTTQNQAAQNVAGFMGVDPSTPLSQVQPSKLANAIAQNEGFTTGTSTIAINHNNPGNLKFTGQPGATKGDPASDGGNYAKFGSVKDGYDALIKDLQSKIDSGKYNTLSDLMSVYSPGTTQLPQWANNAGISQDQFEKLSSVPGMNPTIAIVASEVANGDQPPTTSGLYRNTAAFRAALGALGTPLSKLTLQWNSALAFAKNLNSSQVVRFQGLASSVVNTIDEVRRLGNDLQLGGFTGYNKAKLSAYVNLAGNTPQGQKVAQYLGAVNTLKEEFANLVNGGYAPTEAAFDLANKQVNAEYGVKELSASLDEVQRLIKYRVNSFSEIQGIGTGQYGAGTQPQGSDLSGTTFDGLTAHLPDGSVATFPDQNSLEQFKSDNGL